MKNLKSFLFLTICFTLAACHNGNVQKEEGTVSESLTVESKEFKKIDPKEIPGNPIKKMDEEWMLITAGNSESYNTMTASWGSLGELWSKPVATCYIRPERYTFNFIEKSEYYTLCFFGEEHRAALDFCGTKSGREFPDVNKAEVAGLTPAYTENGAVYFEEAYLVIECKKLYAEQFKKENFTAEVAMNSRTTGQTTIYNETESMHKFYIGEIVNCWIR